MNTESAQPVCPFKVGDLICNTYNQGGSVATVTAVHEKGFDYTYPKPIPFIAREGSSFVGGTCFPIGYDGWCLTSVEEQENEQMALAKAQEYWTRVLSNGHTNYTPS